TMATKDDLQAVKDTMATKDDLQAVKDTMATKDDLQAVKDTMATKDDLQAVKDTMATKDDLQAVSAGLSALSLTVESMDQRLLRVEQNQVRMENELTPKIRALFDAREVQTDINMRILSTLSRVENKVDKMQMETIYLRDK
ncbi:MAG: hypothetical protein KGZ57_01200, partial [Dethiobacter sp.]|nr:hypothetical protein [Dethiobacter sp.]